MRTTEENLEEASGREDKEDWFEKGGCPEMRQVERWNASNCRRNGVNPASLVREQHWIKMNNHFCIHTSLLVVSRQI